MNIENDGNNQPYIAIPFVGAERLRLTYLHTGFNETPRIRIQVHGAGGKLRMGPEISLCAWPDVQAAVNKLITDRR